MSEVFYDSPLEENSANISGHHNGEFIELFNPTTESIKLDNWRIQDSSGYTSYTFPANTIVPARGLIIVAYQYPNSNFKLSDLFPSINSLGLSAESLQKSILYQSEIMLSNKSEIIRLYNEYDKLVDQMSYNHSSTFNSQDGYWDICAHNGSYTNKSIPNPVSLQRNNIHCTYSSITPLASDFTVANATPLQKIVDDANYPTLATLYENTETNYSSNVEVGSLPGTSSVTPTGAATYQIPIEVPPGTNGAQPNLSVTYNSQGGFGVLGQGWDISGLSVISRGTQNFYYDDQYEKLLSTTIEFNSNDRFNLDGQRLIFIGEDGDYRWQAGGEYALEVENYSRVNIKNSSATGQIYFELTTKEGQTVEYGNTTNSIVKNASNTTDNRTLAWRINKVTDVNGNSITYEYSDNGQYISKISYINNTVEFAYQTNTLNPKQHYIGTFLTKQDKLLKSVTTKQNSGVVKTYQFNYLTSDMDLRLDNISLTASDGKTINPTRIQWGAESKIEEVKLDKMWDGNLNNAGNCHLYTGDIDGDGYTDRIEMWEGSQGTNEQGYIAVTLRGNNILPLIYFPATNKTYEHFHSSLVIGDINADGKDEIMLFLPFASYLNVQNGELALLDNPELGLNVFRVNDSNTELTKLQHFNYSRDNSVSLLLGLQFGIKMLAPKWNKNENYSYIPLLSNLNNDKYPDLAIIPYKYQAKMDDSDEKSEKYIVDYYYGGASGLGQKNTIEKSYYMNGKGIVVGDFYAQGKINVREIGISWKDYMININNNLFTGYLANDYIFDWMDNKVLFEELYPVDIDGDGKTDILVRQGIEGGKQWFKTNESRDKNVLNLHNFSRTHEPEGDYAVPIDYNGDGLMDLIIADDWRNAQYGKMDYDDYEKTYWYFYRNIGGKYKLDDSRGGWRYFKRWNRTSRTLPFKPCNYGY
ncbi:MAG: SpvB/TcaC N-terminal domain-containing protein [Paludibacteraceae bacterium]